MMQEPWLIVATRQRPRPLRGDDIVAVTVLDGADSPNFMRLAEEFGQLVRADGLAASKIR